MRTKSVKWQNHTGAAPHLPTNALEHATECLFPKVNRLLRTICTSPCERSVSVLQHLKTYLGLTGLVLLVYTMVDLDRVINILTTIPYACCIAIITLYVHMRSLLNENIIALVLQDE